MAAECKADALRIIAGDRGAKVCITAVAELKNTILSPAHAMPQALVAACSAAVHLATIGLSAADCIVPFVSSTGVLEQHGVAYLLEPCAPCAVLTSPVIDTLDEAGAQAAIVARWVAVKISEETERLVADLLSNGRDVITTPTTPAISPDLYFFKSPLVGLVGKTEVEACFHLTTIFRALRASDAAAEFCVMPLATFMRDPQQGFADTLDIKDPAAAKLVMAFPDISKEGFRPGVPTDATQRADFFRQLKRALVAVHSAGVVHCDLYPQNVMWRARVGGDLASNMAALGVGGGVSAVGATDAGEVDVRIVDWDAALFIGQPIPAGASEIVERNGHTGSYHPGLFRRDVPASPQLDWWHFHMLENGAPFGGADHNAEALDAWLRSLPAGAKQSRRWQLLQLAQASANAESTLAPALGPS